MNASHVLLVARRELVDLRRQKKVWRRLFIQPIALAAMFAVPVFFVQQQLADERSQSFDIAVDGDLDVVPGLRAALNVRRLSTESSDDPARDVISERADVGLVIPADARTSVEAGRPVRLRVFVLPVEDSSRFGGEAAVRRLETLQRDRAGTALAAAGYPPSLARPLNVKVTDLTTTSAAGTRFGLSLAIPSLLVIQLFGLLSTTQERLAGAKDRRVLESLLVLPMRRRDVLTGIGGASMTVGLLAAGVLLVPLTLILSVAVGRLTGTLGGALEIATSLGVGALLLAGFFTSVGLYLGSRAQSGSEGGAFATVVQIAIFAIVATTPFLGELPADGPIVAIPVIGPITLVRHGLEDGLTLVPTLMALVSVVAVGQVLLSRAARLLGTEAAVLRASR